MLDLLKRERARAVLDQPRLFNFVRWVLAGDQRTTHQKLANKIGQCPADRVLDVACGTGDFAYIPQGMYVGFDGSEEFVRFAQKKHIGASTKSFLTADAMRFPFPHKSFDTTLLVNCLHHWSDDLTQAVLGEVTRVTKKQIIIVDLIADTDNIVRRFFNYLDRGDHIRYLKQEISLIESIASVNEVSVHVSRVAPQAFIVCSPRDS